MVAIIVAIVASILFRKSFLFVADDAGAADILIVDLLEIAEQFTLLVIHMGLVIGGFNDSSNAFRLPENTVHLLQ